ncbi:MAG: hypothetical protein FWE74_06900 [Oscillospiraceae bacterium]|nr:hypothetical protein [Oscillospiraceae bacterium]
MTKFDESLKHTFAESRYELCMQNRQTDKEYIKLDNQHSKLFEHISNLLGKNRKLMLKLEALENQKGSIDDKFVYIQGMADCVKLLRVIKLI